MDNWYHRSMLVRLYSGLWICIRRGMVAVIRGGNGSDDGGLLMRMEAMATTGVS